MQTLPQIADNTSRLVGMFDSAAFWMGVISLVVGLASLIVGGFAVWLSWQFFKAAQAQGDRTTEAVGRIENTVSNVHSSINQIVERAVSAWVKSSSTTAEEGIAADLAESYHELQSKLDTLEQGMANPLPPEVLSLITEGQARTEALLNSLRESRMRALFPADSETLKEPAVTAAKFVKDKSSGGEEGEIVLTVHRPARVITGTVQLENEVQESATAAVTLLRGPGDARNLNSSQGIGRCRELNVHVRNSPNDVPIGEYVFKYVILGTS